MNEQRIEKDPAAVYWTEVSADGREEIVLHQHSTGYGSCGWGPRGWSRSYIKFLRQQGFGRVRRQPSPSWPGTGSSGIVGVAAFRK